MPKNKLISEYSKKLDFNENIINEAIISFFTYSRRCMKTSSLPDIRLKGFGVFRPAQSRLKQFLAGIEKRYSKGLIDYEEYIGKKTMIVNYLNEYGNKKSSD
jgi:hypothetical protein